MQHKERTIEEVLQFLEDMEGSDELENIRCAISVAACYWEDILPWLETVKEMQVRFID